MMTEELIKINKWQVKKTIGDRGDLTVTAAGDVADFHDYGNRVDIYSPDGRRKASLHITGSEDAEVTYHEDDANAGDSQLNVHYDFDEDSDSEPDIRLKGIAHYENKLYLTEYTSKSVLVFNTNGKHLQSIKMDVEDIEAVQVHNDRLFVSSCIEHGSVYYKDLSDTGADKTLFVEHSDSHPVEYPDSIAVNDIAVAILCCNYVQVYNPQGDHLVKLQDTRFSDDPPQGVVINKAGQIIVADHDNNCLVIFDTNGQVVKRFDSLLYDPQYLALSPSNTIWVGYRDRHKTVCEFKYTQSM